MRNNGKVIIFIPIFLTIFFIFGGYILVSAVNQDPPLTGDPLTNSTDEDFYLYMPFSANDICTAQLVESPFSIEIAALHQITTTNLMDQEINEEQFNAWYNQAFPSLVAALQDSGAGWTRIVIRWFDIEPKEPEPGQPPTYDLAWLQWYDDRLSQISQAGVKMIAVINSPPAWANNSVSCPEITSDHVQEYQQFLTDIVTRYSQSPYNIKNWEIFNEADMTTANWDGFTCFGEFGSDYTDILSKSYLAIKTVDPNATVLMSGIAYESWNEDPYNGPFYRYFPDDVMLAGGASYFDALNFHYFPDFHHEWERWNPPAQPPTCGRPPEAGQGLAYDGSGIDLIAKTNFFTNRMSTCFSVDKPVWLTEMAEHGVITDSGSLRNQAYYVLKGYSRGLAAGIKNITWFALGDPLDGFDQSLLTTDFSPKPAFYSYKTLVAQLTNYTYDRTLSIPEGEAYVFRNSCNDEKIVAWGNNAPLNVSPATSLEVTDYLGNVSAIQDGGPGDGDGSQNDSIQVMLSLDPMTGSIIVINPVPIPVFIRVTSP